MSLRDSLVYYAWLCELLIPLDVVQLHHTPKMLAAHWPTQYFDPSALLRAAAVIPLSRQCRPPSPPGCSVVLSHTSPLVRSRMRRHHLPSCDGSVCQHRCWFMHWLFASVPCWFDWSSSPLLAECDDGMLARLVIKRPRCDVEQLVEEQDRVQSAGQQLLELLYSQQSCNSASLTRSPLSSESLGSPTHAQIPNESLLLSSSTEAGQERSPEPSSEANPLIEVQMWLQVNSSFERLLGYSQSELRSMFLTDGEKVWYQLVRSDAWESLMLLEKEMKWNMRKEYRVYVMLINKWQVEVPCLLHALYIFDNTGRQQESRISIVPLPDASSGPQL